MERYKMHFQVVLLTCYAFYTRNATLRVLPGKDIPVACL